MAEISLCMIVRDEENVLGRCLESVAGVVDEMIIVDTGSVDRTKEIAAKFTDQIYDFPWIDDFAAARNFAFSKGTKDYLMWMDADDVLPAQEKRKLEALKEELSEKPCDIVMMLYEAAFDEQGKGTFSYYRERLIRRGRGAKWEGCVHEVISPFGEICYRDIRIEHRKEKTVYSDRNLRIYEKMLEKGLSLHPREQFYYARELYYHGRYEQAAETFQKFLEEPLGWLENKLEAVRFCSHCFSALGRKEEAADLLFHSLKLAPPTGELCCEIGAYFMEKKEWVQAVFWYENALRAKKRTESGAFVQEECYGYLPSIQLCVCYDKLGDWETAKMYNDMAGLLKPGDRSVQQNQAYFQKYVKK